MSMSVPGGAVTRRSNGVACAVTGSLAGGSSSRSRGVRMPASRPSAPSRSRLDTSCSRICTRASPTVALAGTRYGSAITRFSARLTRSTIADLVGHRQEAVDDPTPPARAMAIAMRASVTVSMFAAATGTAIVSPRVSRVRVETSERERHAGAPRRQEDVVVGQQERGGGHRLGRHARGVA